MKARIAKKLGLTHALKAPSQSPLLEDDSFIRQCLLDANEGKVHTLKEVADKLRISKETVRRAVRGQVGCIRIRSEYRIPQALLDRMILGFLKPPEKG
jgi:excisionase family DNA binding protein